MAIMDSTQIMTLSDYAIDIESNNGKVKSKGMDSPRGNYIASAKQGCQIWDTIPKPCDIFVLIQFF